MFYLHIRHSLHLSVHSLNPLLHNLLLFLHLLYILPNHRDDIRIVALFKMVMIEEAEEGKDLQNMNRAENFTKVDIEINA